MLASVLAGVALAYSMISSYAYHRPKWFPDTRFYAVRALEFAGRTHEEARAEAGAFLRSRGVTDPIDVVDVPDARLFRPRLLYPLLSAPFVRLFGMNGMLVVPFVSMLAFAAILWRMLMLRGPPFAALAVFALVVNSGWISIYTVAALTDGLALAFVAAAAVGFPTEHRPRGRPVLVCAMAVAAGLTREVAPYLLATAAVGWLWCRARHSSMERGWRLALLGAAAATNLTVAFATASGPGKLLYQVEKFARGDSILEALPRLYVGALDSTIWALRQDRFLVAVLVLAFLSLVVGPRREGLLMVAATSLAAGLLLLNPIATNFRLQLPLVPFAATAAVVGIEIARAHARRLLAAYALEPVPVPPTPSASEPTRGDAERSVV